MSLRAQLAPGSDELENPAHLRLEHSCVTSVVHRNSLLAPTILSMLRRAHHSWGKVTAASRRDHENWMQAISATTSTNWFPWLPTRNRCQDYRRDERTALSLM